ncbi:MAG: O-acetyl-ADP-ribose deacetylase [Deltaproteobacteria bacterium]|nr:O-acetyl-ADP-ribose deacetylase [Deltaproteobacteria bacterium]MCL5791839.1 O-acetyl-ADP-ribose deacetylase [Deltaproteobacteria bacterium]
MEITIENTIVSIVKGDITLERTDAIVNAANSRLAGGGGVDGAIHRAGGPKIMEECRKLNGCPTGSAVITTGGNLKARCVIHAVGPIYNGGQHGEDKLLSGAYKTSLELAVNNDIKSIAFPSISTGVYGYPIDKASEIAVKTVVDFIETNKGLSLVRFVLFSNNDLKVYEEALERLTAQKQ